MNSKKVNEKVRFEALLYAVFAALLPLNQAIKLPGGRTINQVSGIVLLVIYGLSYLMRNKAKIVVNRDLIPLYFFIVWNFLASMWSIAGFSLPINLMGSFLMLLLCLEKKFNSRELKFIERLILLVYTALSLFIIFSASQNSLRAVLSSSTGEADPNSIALALSVAFILALNRVLSGKSSIFIIVSMIAVALAMLCTGSRTGLVAVLAASFYLTMKKTKHSRKKIVGIFVIVLAMYATLQILIAQNIFNLRVLDRLTLSDVAETGGNGRIDIWKIYLEAIFDNPIRMLIGYGTGSFTSIAYMFAYRQVTPHNDYIGYAATLGLIGFAFFVALLVNFIKKGRETNSSMSIALIIILMIGCLTICYFEKKDASNMLILSWQFAALKQEESNRIVYNAQ